MEHDFLGVGWWFEVAPREPLEGAVSPRMAYYEESIRQSIWIILSTARGERVMRPDFGCGIHNLVFALQNATTAGLVRHEVEQALLFWEPRIEVLRVTADPDPSEPALLISVEYRVKSTNSRSNVVYPFYLERGLR
jgi:phage baseplate assembly protein W